MRGDLKNQLAIYRKAHWALVAVLLLIGIVVYCTSIRSSNARLAALRLQFAVQRSVLQTDQDQARDLPKIELEIASLRKRVEGFDKKLPEQLDMGDFINEVTEISRQTSLQKLTYTPDSKPRRTDQFAELPIQFSFQGDFGGVFDFLRRTEDMQRLTRVRKLDVKSVADKPGQVDVQLTMNIYFAEE